MHYAQRKEILWKEFVRNYGSLLWNQNHMNFVIMVKSMTKRALPVGIYRNSRTGDCSNHGISSRFNEILLLCDDGFIEVDTENPPENLCKVVKRNIGFTEFVHIEPVASVSRGNVGWMNGGAICHTSDSRFHRCTGIDYPICLHDRQETQTQYNMLSF